MKDFKKLQINELTKNDLQTTNGGFLLGSSGFNWGNFWKGVGIGSAAGAAGAAVYYA